MSSETGTLAIVIPESGRSQQTSFNVSLKLVLASREAAVE
jgi:hypothetical protein